LAAGIKNLVAVGGPLQILVSKTSTFFGAFSIKKSIGDLVAGNKVGAVNCNIYDNGGGDSAIDWDNSQAFVKEVMDKYGDAMKAAAEGDPVKDPPSTIYEKTKHLHKYLPFSVNFGMGVFAWGEGLASYFANYNYSTYRSGVIHSSIDRLTFGFYGHAQTFTNVIDWGSRFAAGEFSAGNIEFGLGYVSAPIALSYGGVRIGIGLGRTSSSVNAAKTSFKNLKQTYGDLVEQSTKKYGGNVTVQRDGVDLFRVHQASSGHGLKVTQFKNNLAPNGTVFKNPIDVNVRKTHLKQLQRSLNGDTRYTIRTRGGQ
jgi:hypothetical protein